MNIAFIVLDAIGLAASAARSDPGSREEENYTSENCTYGMPATWW
jgi:hypothetical protein